MRDQIVFFYIILYIFIFNFLVFEKLNTFLPEFINNTKEILKDKEKLDKIRIEKNKEIKRIKLNELDKEIPSKYIYKTKNKSNEKEIQMVKN